MAQRARLYLLVILVPLLFGTGPCYCGPGDECDMCGALGCEDDNVTECSCGGFEQLVQFSREDCSAKGLSCTVIRSPGRIGDVNDLGFAMCMEACSAPGEVECRRGSAGLFWEVCHSAACGLEEPGGAPGAVCLEELRERVRARLAHEAQAPVAGSGGGLRWLHTAMPCDECASSCACPLGFDCRDGHCVAGDADRDLVCCGRERLTPCSDGAECQRLDGTTGRCDTVGRCEACASDRDCERDRCIDNIGGLPAVCLTTGEASQVERRCRPETGSVWRKDACDRWIAEVDVCRQGFYCDDLRAECMPVAPSIQLDPTRIVFAETLVGQTAVRQVQISNDGRATLAISSFSLAGSDASQFSVDRTSAEVPVGTSITVQVTFVPTLAGEFEAQLTIRSNDFARPVVSIPIDAVGVR
jgi:hypothetical protein